MLLQDHPVKQVMFGYQFHFGLGSKSDAALDEFCPRCPFRGMAIGCYHTSRDTNKQCHEDKNGKLLDASVQQHPIYLPVYQKNVQRRIRPLYRQLRDTLVVEFKPIPITGLAVNDEILAIPSETPTLRMLLLLQKIGIGSVVVWVDGVKPRNEDQWRSFRDPRLLTLHLDAEGVARTKWPLISLVRYVVLLSHLALDGISTKSKNLENHDCINSDAELDKYLNDRIAGLSEDSPVISAEIDNYPFFFIHYDMTTAQLRREFLQKPADVRLALCGDKNWACKAAGIVEASVVQADVSSRESILWLVNSEGTVKLVSSELETDVNESITATFVETDIILTMRYFLQLINGLLLRLSKTSLTPDQLADLRHKLFSNIDKYCNMEVSHKDTTRRRLEQCKEIFRIDSLYKSVVERFDLLSSMLGTRHTLAIQQQQTLLTLVFGFFSSLSVLFAVFSKWTYIARTGWLGPLSLSLCGATATGVALWFVTKALRNKGNRLE